MQFELKESAIKRLLEDEIKDGIRELQQMRIGGWQENFIRWGADIAFDRLEECETYEDLDEYITHMYRMTLKEWVESL